MSFMEEIRHINKKERYEKRRSLLELMNQRILKLFVHIKRVDDERLTQDIFKDVLNETRGKDLLQWRYF